LFRRLQLAIRRRIYVQSLLLLGLVACSNARPIGNGVLPSNTESTTVFSNEGLAGPKQALYITNLATPPGQINEYTLSGSKIAMIQAGMKYPRQILFDGNGTMYVANFPAQPYFTEYGSGNNKLLRTIKRGISTELAGAGVDSSGNLWVLSVGGPLVRYLAGENQPQFSSYKGLCVGGFFGSAAQLAVDTFGTAYVGVSCGSTPSGPSRNFVREFDGTRSVARSIQIPNNEQPVSLTTDSDGRLYLEYWSGASGKLGVAEYARRTTTPSVTFQVTPSVSYDSAFISFDSKNAYISLGDCESSGHGANCTSFVSVYPRGSSKLVKTIDAPSGSLFGGTAVDRVGNIYVYSTALRARSVPRIVVYPNGDASGKSILKSYRLGNPMIYPPSD
jgi:hypothetical protein